MENSSRGADLSHEASPAPKRVRIARWLKVLLVADLALILGLVTFWLWWSRDDPRAAVGNDGLHGSVAPKGQTLPDLSGIAGVQPALPKPSDLRGDRVLLVGTCFDCRSGDVIGGGLRRLGAMDDLPGGLRIVVAGWEGSAEAWRAKWSLPERIELHVAAPGTATAQLAHELRLDPDTAEGSGYAYLYDAKGRWRSSFPAQLVLPEDIIHDARAID